MNSQLDVEQIADDLVAIANSLRLSLVQTFDHIPTHQAVEATKIHGNRRPALRNSAKDQGRPLIVNPARFVTIEMCAAVTGLTKGAVGKRIERGYWIEGRQFRKAADGRIWIDMQAVEKWVQGMP